MRLSFAKIQQLFKSRTFSLHIVVPHFFLWKQFSQCDIYSRFYEVIRLYKKSLHRPNSFFILFNVEKVAKSLAHGKIGYQEKLKYREIHVHTSHRPFCTASPICCMWSFKKKLAIKKS